MKNVDSGHRRHKCSICGSVRFEKWMSKIRHYYYGGGGFYVVKTRYGNDCWFCVDNPDCRRKSKYFRVY